MQLSNVTIVNKTIFRTNKDGVKTVETLRNGKLVSKIVNGTEQLGDGSRSSDKRLEDEETKKRKK